MKNLFLSFLALLFCSIMAYAVPARPGWHSIKQSDGTILTVQTVGNAFNNAILTRDGLMVARGADGDFYYNSSLTGLTAMRAHNVEDRSATETAFVAAQSSNLTMQSRQSSKSWQRFNGLNSTGGSNADAGVPAIGPRRIPIILVEFKDKKFNNTREAIIDAMLTGNESVGQYFRDQSNGMYQPEFDVYGIYTMSKNREAYGGHSGNLNDKGLGALVTEAVKKASSQGVFFEPYDTNRDNYCDVVIVIYAGVSESSASTTHPEAIWPCHWDLSSASYYNDGNGPFRPTKSDPIVNEFAVFNELYGDDDDGSTIDGIGTFVHEFGHCLGLPDFYDHNGNYYGLGYWSVMCMGCYNNDGFTPPGYSAYEKVFMGWLDYETPQPGTYYTLPVWNQKNAATDKALCIKSDINSDEYFILENRRKQGWDRFMHGEGIMITHVTFNASRWNYNSVNGQAIQLMTLMNADNTWSYYDEQNDLWPQGSNNAFTDDSTPAAKLNMKSNGSITGNAGFLGKPVTDMVINQDGSASFWYMREAVTEPQVIVVKDTIDFGDVMLGTTGSRTFTIIGTQLNSNVDITMQDNVPFGYSPSTVSAEDAYNGYEVTVTFSPTVLGECQTVVYVNSEGAEGDRIVLKGRGVIHGYTPVMQPANSAFINLTQFRADWTDQTPAEDVANYTLEVKTKPLYVLLETADFSSVPNALSEDGNYLLNVVDDYEDYLPEGWWAATYLCAYRNALLLGRNGTIYTPVYDFSVYDKVTVVARVASYYYDSSSIKIMTSKGEQELVLDKTYADYTVVLDCDNFDMVMIQALENYTNIKQVDIYAGDLTATPRVATEYGDAAYRLITDITDKFYTVENLQAAGTYVYKVKAHYIDGTESPWSNTKEVTLFDNSHPYAVGDVNHDGAVDVEDVTSLISMVLGNDSNGCPVCANVDQVGAIDINDVTVLISMVLGGE